MPKGTIIYDKYRYGRTTYHWHIKVSPRYSGVLCDYIEYIKKYVCSLLLHRLDINRDSLSLLRTYSIRVPFVRRGSYVYELRNMERGTIPPRHIWDAKFPNSVTAKVNIDHKVTTPELKRKGCKYSIQGNPLSNTDIDILRRYTLELSTLLETSGGIASRLVTRTEAHDGTSTTQGTVPSV